MGNVDKLKLMLGINVVGWVFDIVLILFIYVYMMMILEKISFEYEYSDIYQLFIDSLGRIFGGFGFGIFFMLNGFLVKGYIFG